MILWENWRTLKDIADEEDINLLVEELIELVVRRMRAKTTSSVY